MSNYPDDVRGADVERAHGGPDLHALFDEVRARECVCCEAVLVPATEYLCAACEDDDDLDSGAERTVYACRRCDRWVEYAETGDHAADHARRDAEAARDGDA